MASCTEISGSRVPLREDERVSTGFGELKDIVPAAYYGRVYALLVALSQYCWGAFDLETGAVKFLPGGQPVAEDLLDFAAAHTLINNGDVYVIQPEDVPENKAMAAIFRH